jgi:uncharacterized protein YjbJ (UPF0337 family)
MIMILFVGLVLGQVPGQNAPIQDTPVGPEQETRALSGQLKELHGQVHHQLGLIDRELAEVKTGKRKELLSQMHTDLINAQEEIETALNEVNDKTSEMIERSNIEELMVRVNSVLERAKVLNASAVN